MREYSGRVRLGCWYYRICIVLWNEKHRPEAGRQGICVEWSDRLKWARPCTPRHNPKFNLSEKWACINLTLARRISSCRIREPIGPHQGPIPRGLTPLETLEFVRRRKDIIKGRTLFLIPYIALFLRPQSLILPLFYLSCSGHLKCLRLVVFVRTSSTARHSISWLLLYSCLFRKDQLNRAALYSSIDALGSLSL